MIIQNENTLKQFDRPVGKNQGLSPARAMFVILLADLSNCLSVIFISYNRRVRVIVLCCVFKFSDEPIWLTSLLILIRD